MTFEKYTKQYKQEAARLEMKISRLTQQQWGEASVLIILKGASNDAILHIAVEHAKFAGIFTAGHQLADWCFKELDYRRSLPDYKLTVSELMFGRLKA